MAKPRQTPASNVAATATAYRGKTSGFLFKVTFGENFGWLNYNSVADEINDSLQEGIEDALGVRSSGSLTLKVKLSATPDLELRSGKKFLNLSDIKIVDFEIV